MRKQAFRTITLLSFFFTLVVASAEAQSTQDHEARWAREEYTLASLQGDYALVGTYGANAARLIGTFTADGRGNFAGSARLNAPAPNGQRMVVPITFEGIYTTNPDGTGTISATVNLPNGTAAPATIDFIITKAKVARGRKLATEFATAQREPSTVIGAEFVTHIATRRPD